MGGYRNVDTLNCSQENKLTYHNCDSQQTKKIPVLSSNVNCEGSTFDVAVITKTSPTSTSDQDTVKSVITKPVVFVLSMLYVVIAGVMVVTGRLPA